MNDVVAVHGSLYRDAVGCNTPDYVEKRLLTME